VTEQNQQEQQAGLGVQKIYLKDCSFEAPNTPNVFTQQIETRFHVDIDIAHSELDKKEGIHEVVVQITVKAENENGAVFLIEVHQAGVFQVTGVDEATLQQALEINCADILLPYARQAISSLVTSGGFPQLLINPVNFEQLYEQRHGSAQAE